MANQVRVLVADGQEIFRRGLTGVLGLTADLTVVAEAGTVDAATRRAGLMRPDLLLVDLELPGGGGLGVVREVRSGLPLVRSVVLTCSDDGGARSAAREAGAHAFVLKSARCTELVDIARSVAAGKTLLRQSLGLACIAGGNATPVLTLNEWRIVDLIGDGLSNREIGEALGIAEKTVKNHVTPVLAKMGLQRRTQIAAFAARRRDRDWHRV
ncbi:response regulator transcription factor [Ruania alkalisoli]|uniref:Response regulator transcription factor n=1 Tax=Ruania alkalisoli TaxID=2779775 RepID=A0A7M1SU44_9MICO|nr:response regulator transcription factor [Ruania alkalisoli]QOR70464.1 response regulator transcription factor [Ruania alkalisoli]